MHTIIVTKLTDRQLAALVRFLKDHHYPPDFAMGDTVRIRVDDGTDPRALPDFPLLTGASIYDVSDSVQDSFERTLQKIVARAAEEMDSRHDDASIQACWDEISTALDRALETANIQEEDFLKIGYDEEVKQYCAIRAATEVATSLTEYLVLLPYIRSTVSTEYRLASHRLREVEQAIPELVNRKRSGKLSASTPAIRELSSIMKKFRSSYPVMSDEWYHQLTEYHTLHSEALSEWCDKYMDTLRDLEEYVRVFREWYYYHTIPEDVDAELKRIVIAKLAVMGQALGYC